MQIYHRYNESMNIGKKTLIIPVLLAVIAVLGYFGLQMWRGETETDSSSLFTQEAANPFEENANPYADIKTNPFE